MTTSLPRNIQDIILFNVRFELTLFILEEYQINHFLNFAEYVFNFNVSSFVRNRSLFLFVCLNESQRLDLASWIGAAGFEPTLSRSQGERISQIILYSIIQDRFYFIAFLIPIQMIKINNICCYLSLFFLFLLFIYILYNNFFKKSNWFFLTGLQVIVPISTTYKILLPKPALFK